MKTWKIGQILTNGERNKCRFLGTPRGTEARCLVSTDNRQPHASQKTLNWAHLAMPAQHESCNEIMWNNPSSFLTRAGQGWGTGKNDMGLMLWLHCRPGPCLGGAGVQEEGYFTANFILQLREAPFFAVGK